MPKTALAIRRDDMPRREPPMASTCTVAKNECTPPEQLDAAKASANALIAKGERLAEVVKRLKALRLRKTQLLGSDVSRRRNLYVQIEKIITFAETGG